MDFVHGKKKLVKDKMWQYCDLVFWLKLIESKWTKLKQGERAHTPRHRYLIDLSEEFDPG